jgi:hypothetical protein
MAGQTRGAIGLSLNFLFLFCSSKKEKESEQRLNQVKKIVGIHDLKA